MSVASKMTAIADKIRGIVGTSGAMGLDSMANNLEAARINIDNSFTAVENKGGTVPSSKSILNLPGAIQSIPEGAALNFEVVGGDTAPENPKENTIWINTSTPITNWAISADDPYVEHVHLVTDDTKITEGYYLCETDGVYSYAAYEQWDHTTNFLPLPENTVSVTIPTKEFSTSKVGHWFIGADGVMGENATFVARDSTNFTYTVPSGTDKVSASMYKTDPRTVIANVNNAEDGDIWIIVDSSSNNAQFVTLETNGISLCLIAAKQYVSGAWQKKTTKIYRNGEWIPCVTRLYDGGVTEYSIHSIGMRPNSSFTSPMTASTITFRDSSVTVSNTGSSSSGSCGAAYLSSKIDLTDASTLYIEGDFTPSNTQYKAYPCLSVWSSIGEYAADNRYTYVSPCSATGAATTKTATLSIKNAKGLYYVGLNLYATANNTCSAVIRQIYYD